MSQDQTYPPQTAYEALTGLFPQHFGHTVMKVRFHLADQLDITCNCGTEWLPITGKTAAVQGWDLRAVKHALRNVSIVR